MPLLILCGLCGLAALSSASASEQRNDAVAAVMRLAERVPGFRIVDLELSASEVTLAAEDSLTVEDLRGAELDDQPPALGSPAYPYDPHQADGYGPGEAPYVARGIAPFRLREFTCEFNYGGWHNFQMIEYAATHGFSVIYPYVMPDLGHFPEGTSFLQWGSFVDWHRFMREHGMDADRYDQLARLDVARRLSEAGAVWPYHEGWIAMLDLEHGVPLSPDDLSEQAWYPTGAPGETRKAFEDDYYSGYLSTYTGPVQALREAGWRSVGVYPQPYGSGWYALLSLADKGLPGTPDPQTYWPWVRYGRAMAESQDVLYPDIYVYYWSPQNLAYTLARIDFDRALLATLPSGKPYRPYFWPLLHGGSAEPQWWNQQPLPNEDVRAMFAFCFFAGCDGLVLWNWSDTGNHHVPPPLWQEQQPTPVGPRAVEGGTGADVMVGEEFLLAPEGAGADAVPTRFRRYDVIAVSEVDAQAGTVRFQRIDTVREKWGPRVDTTKPTYVMRSADLIPHLRPTSEPVAAAVEGLALVKVLEPVLRRGEVRVDVPALDQFAKALPVVRRVKIGPLHIIATYNPRVVHLGEGPATVVLADFDGHAGLTLRVPADEETRVFVLREVE